MHPPKKEGAHGNTRSAGQKMGLVPAIYETNAAIATDFTPAALQVESLIRRFPLTRPVARVVAELHWRAA